MRIGIDLMGSDSSPLDLFEAVIYAAKRFDPSYSFVVLATQDIVNQLNQTYQSFFIQPLFARIVFQITSEVITMSDDPLAAIRQKKNSSLVVGMKLLKKKNIQALISAGSTGALLASATLFLPKLSNVTRPALLAFIPTQTGKTIVLDVGGNVHCKARHLLQFVWMGIAFQRCLLPGRVARVGLLNIGIESQKGTTELRQVYEKLVEKQRLQLELKHSYMNFIGNIESKDVFAGAVDVLVTDGFTGNVFLKTSEGAASFIFNRLEEISAHLSQETTQFIDHLKADFDHTEYAGAMLCGVDALVIKCHGSASPKSIYNSIQGVINQHQSELLKRFKQELDVVSDLNAV